MEKSQHSVRYRRLLKAIEKARVDSGLSQTEASTRLAAYRTFISKVEQGERRLDVIELADLCKLYRVNLHSLLRSIGL